MGLFSRFGKKKSTQRPAVGSSQPAVPSAGALNSASPAVQSPQARLRDAIMQTLSAPLGRVEDAWNWAFGELRYFKSQGVPEDELYFFERNILVNLTDAYARHFDEFRALVGDGSCIIMVCEELLSADHAEKAKAIADPYYKWLVNTPAEWADGQLCFQEPVEIAMFHLKNPQVEEVRRTNGNYTHFLVLYCKILDGILPDTLADIDEKAAVKRRALEIAARISPCNSTVWNALANVHSDDPETYRGLCGKALEYCTRSGTPYGFGQIYSDMALNYAVEEPDLGWALAEVAQVYDGDPMAALFVLAKRGYANLPGKNAISIVEGAGIQVGYSDTFRAAAALVGEETL